MPVRIHAFFVIILTLFLVAGVSASGQAQGEFYVSPNKQGVEKNIPNAVPKVPMPDTGTPKAFGRDQLPSESGMRAKMPYVSPAMRQETPRSGTEIFQEALTRGNAQRLTQEQNTLGMIDQAMKLPQAKIQSNAQEPANTQELLAIATARRSGAIARVMTGSF